VYGRLRYTACEAKPVQIVNASQGLSSRCSHLWTSRDERVSLDACVTEAYARSGNAINHDPVKHHCNVKRCKTPPGELSYNDVTYDVVVNSSDVTTTIDYRLTNIHGGWDVYAIIRQ